MSKYEDIANDIIKKIKSGDYPTGEPLPDQKRMAQDYSTSRMTLQKSLSILKTKGYVYSKQGAATYVKSNADSVVMNVGVDQYGGTLRLFGDKHKVVSQIIEFNLRYPDEKEQKDLKITATDAIYDIKRLRIIDDEPYALEYTKMPVNVIPGINEDVLHASVYQYIQDDLKLKIGAADRIIFANKTTDDDVEYLKVGKNDPILNVTQVVYLDDGTPFESSSSDHPYNAGGYHVFLNNKND